MIEFPVKIKWIGGDGKDIGKSASGGTSVSGGRGSSAKGDKGAKKTNSLLGNIGKSLGAILAVATLVTTLLKPILDLVGALIAIISTVIIKPLTPFLDDIANGFKVIAEWLNEGGLSTLWEDVKTWIVDGAKRLWENSSLKQGFDKWVQDLKELSEGLKSIWNALKTVGIWVWETILKPAWEFLLDVGVWIWEEFIKPAWEYLLEVGKWVWEQILKPAWDFLKDVGVWIWEQIIKPAFTYLMDMGIWIWNIIKKPFEWIADKLSGLSFFGLGSKSNEGKAFGGLVTRDGMMMHAGETVSRGATTGGSSTSNNITINVNGSAGASSAANIARELRRTLDMYSRW